MIVAALGYFICPIDLISDFLPFDFVDDLAILTTTLGQVYIYKYDRVNLEQAASTRALLKTIKEFFVKNDNHEGCHSRALRRDISQLKNIKMIEGSPVCGEKLWASISEVFYEFDRIHPPEITACDFWINYDYPVNTDLSHWELDISSCSITYKEAKDMEYYHKETLI